MASCRLCQFVQARVRVAFSSGLDLPPNDLGGHIKGTEETDTKSIGSLKGRVWSPLALCSCWYLCDVDIALFSGRVLPCTAVAPSLIGEESQLGWQTLLHILIWHGCQKNVWWINSDFIDLTEALVHFLEIIYLIFFGFFFCLCFLF